MKNLKKSGVPFRARLELFGQHAVFALMCVGLLMLTPFLVVWAMLHESGDEFILDVTEVVNQRSKLVERQKAELVRRYSGDAAADSSTPEDAG